MGGCRRFGNYGAVARRIVQYTRGEETGERTDCAATSQPVRVEVRYHFS